MTCNKPNWILLKECGEKLTKAGIVPFTRRHLINCVHKKHPERKEGSLNPMIQGMTVNLKGGAPGGIGKAVFYSEGRGRFVLYNPKKHANQKKFSVEDAQKIRTPIEQATEEIEVEEFFPQEKKSTEEEIRDLIMSILYHRIGKQGSWKGSSKKAEFELSTEFEGYKCYAERSLPYSISTDYTITHNSDILFEHQVKKRYISIEIKHRSAVTDQFKCRSYDIIHLKKEYGNKLLGILIYVKDRTGISIEHAKKICYSFDYFFAIPSRSKHIPDSWNELTAVIKEFLISNS